MALRALIEGAAERDEAAPALLAVDRPAASYGDLLRGLDVTTQALREAGVGPDDVVATSLPNGAETAACFLAVASSATCAPLNPGYTAAEADFYLEDLAPRALVVPAHAPGAATEAARARGIAVLGLEPVEGPAGSFRLEPIADERAAPATVERPSDTALILHTSGTTSRPKQVALTHANLQASAANVATALELTAEDRCLSVMPLFHIHGLVAALLGSLYAGASVVATPPFEASGVFDWIAAGGPTWYTAVPTIHHAILGAARSRPGAAAAAALRFIRSSSASLPPQLLHDLEAEFGAPVVEAYGMTEAAHQIACNPLPPRRRKPGTVGVAAGPEVGILLDDRIAPPGHTGEIVLRGRNVTSGYVSNPEATAAAFTADGWFRTGDEGVIDDDGYITITGRLKELINRGGEKVAPREVEEVLLEHDDVGEAVAFALPHPTLGEDVGAAVVPRPGATIDPDALRHFAGERLAAFKVPRRVVVLDSIPLGATGKVQRVGLAGRLGLDARATGGEAARSGLEGDLADIWRAVLHVEGDLMTDDDFFDLGGNSLLAVQLVVEISERLGVEVGLAELAEITTLGALADRVRGGVGAEAGGRRNAVLLQPGDPALPPIFLVPGRGGTALSLYRLATKITTGHPVYALEAVGLRAGEQPLRTIEQLARHHVATLRALGAAGPYLLAGYSVGGLVAYEMARLLSADGEAVDVVVMIDTACPGPPLTATRRALMNRSRRQARRVMTKARLLARSWRRAVGDEDASATAEGREREPVDGRRQLRPVIAAQRSAGWRYRPGRYHGPLAVLSTGAKREATGRADLGWAQLVDGPIATHPIPGTHVTAAREPHVADLARALSAVLSGSGSVDFVREEGR